MFFFFLFFFVFFVFLNQEGVTHVFMPKRNLRYSQKIHILIPNIFLKTEPPNLLVHSDCMTLGIL